MNMIFDTAPTFVNISGHSFSINYDFRIGMKFEQLSISGISEDALLKKALTLYFPETPQDITAAIDKIIWFYSCGNSLTPAEKSKSARAFKRIYDFAADAPYIYAAFLQQYKIDLVAEKLHWWKFKALLLSLSQDTMFSKIMSYRSADTSKLKGAEKKQMLELQEIYKIPLAPEKQTLISEIKQKLLTTGILD